MQYIYRRYTRRRAGIAATVIHYRPRSAVREVGKALGLSEDITQRLADTTWGSWGGEMPVERFVEAGLDPEQDDIARLQWLVAQLLTFPRHLSQARKSVVEGKSESVRGDLGGCRHIKKKKNKHKK